MKVHNSSTDKNDYLGRDEELKYIEQAITSEDRSRHMIYVYGPGGVGKTALIDQIIQSYPNPDVPDILLAAVDFDDLTLRLPTNFMERIAQELSGQESPESFKEFWRLHGLYDDYLLEQRSQCQRDVTKAFVQGLQDLTQQKRLVLLIDTLEKVPIWFPDSFAELVSPVQNIVIVLVGRPASKDIEGKFQKKVSEFNELPPFSREEFKWAGLDVDLCENYFASREEFKKFNYNRTLLTVPISLDMQKRVWHLVQGIPFQVNLFVGLLRFLESGSYYQLTEHINSLLEEIQAADVDELKHDRKLQWRFEQALVSPFVHNFDHLDVADEEYEQAWLTSRIIMLIAHVNHYMAHALGGFDAAVLADLDEALTEEQVQRGLKYIEENRKTRFSFVKLFWADGEISGIGLHDEMARMLNTLGWPTLDTATFSDSLRCEISSKLIDYYDHRCLERYATDEEKAKITGGGLDLPEKVWKRAVSFPKGQALLLARAFHGIYRDFKAGWQWIYNLSEHIFRLSYFDALLYDSVEAYIQSTRMWGDPDIEARMNIWKAGALIAPQDLSHEDLSRARLLIQDSIEIWREEYQDDEIEAEQVEKTRGTLRDLRRRASEQLRDNPQQVALKSTVESFDKQLDNIERLIQEKAQFSDLERAYTLLGFIYRLEGKWEKAINNYENALRYSRWLGNRGNIAELTNNIANVYLLWGKLTNAALYAQIGAIIRAHLGAQAELGHSYWILGIINWRIGNTYECRKYLDRARNCYEQPVDLARVDLYEGYTYYRIGDTEIGHQSLEKLPILTKDDSQGLHYIPPVRSFPLLEQARDVFQEYERKNDLSWTYNVLSRAYRRDDEFEKAEEAALEALELTKDPMREAEAHLSLCMLYYRWGFNKLRDDDKKGALEEFEKVDTHYNKGFPLAQEGRYVSLMSVYQGVKGNIEYERGELTDPAYYSKAFKYYLNECQIAAQNKILRFERALNEVVADRLARMPVDLALECADILTDFESWKTKDLEKEYKILEDEVDELKLFLGMPEKEQIDKMEESFNQHMRFGNYQEALVEAKNALQQFRRYNWSIETVRVLLKTAQAYRKVTQFTSARRYCKQALLVIDNILRREKNETENIELVKQGAHTHFTMGRILWEIGNTAEAATHFRQAREVYLEHRNHSNPAIAREMREGLARSVQYEGFMRFRIGEFNQALQFLDWVESEYRDMGNIRRVSKVLNLKARIYRDRDDEDKNDIEKACQALDEALKLVLEVKDNYTIAECYLTYMILEYQKSQKANDKEQRLEFLQRSEDWYNEGISYAEDNNYALLQAVYEGVLGNIRFDRLMLEAEDERDVDLRPAFDQYLEECRWDTYYEERRFFRSLDLLMLRLSNLSSDEICFYNEYILENWKRYAREGRLPDPSREKQYAQSANTYLEHMEKFYKLLEEFDEYIATER